MSGEVEFEWPWQYNFPPFFTLQPNENTKKIQLEDWQDLILSYFKSKRQCILDVTSAGSLELFNNKSLKRRLNAESLAYIINYLKQQGKAEQDADDRLLIYWRSPEEWANLVYNFVEKNGLNNTVCTIYELLSGDDTIEEEFHGLEKEVFMKALKVLETKEKAEIISMDDSEGVKFF